MIFSTPTGLAVDTQGRQIIDAATRQPIITYETANPTVRVLNTGEQVQVYNGPLHQLEVSVFDAAQGRVFIEAISHASSQGNNVYQTQAQQGYQAPSAWNGEAQDAWTRGQPVYEQPVYEQPAYGQPATSAWSQAAGQQPATTSGAYNPNLPIEIILDEEEVVKPARKKRKKVQAETTAPPEEFEVLEEGYDIPPIPPMGGLDNQPQETVKVETAPVEYSKVESAYYPVAPHDGGGVIYSENVRIPRADPTDVMKEIQLQVLENYEYTIDDGFLTQEAYDALGDREAEMATAERNILRYSEIDLKAFIHKALNEEEKKSATTIARLETELADKNKEFTLAQNKISELIDNADSSTSDNATEAMKKLQEEKIEDEATINILARRAKDEENKATDLQSKLTAIIAVNRELKEELETAKTPATENVVSEATILEIDNLKTEVSEGRVLLADTKAKLSESLAEVKTYKVMARDLTNELEYIKTGVVADEQKQEETPEVVEQSENVPEPEVLEVTNTELSTVELYENNSPEELKQNGPLNINHRVSTSNEAVHLARNEFLLKKKEDVMDNLLVSEMIISEVVSVADVDPKELYFQIAEYLGTGDYPELLPEYMRGQLDNRLGQWFCSEVGMSVVNFATIHTNVLERAVENPDGIVKQQLDRMMASYRTADTSGYTEMFPITPREVSVIVTGNEEFIAELNELAANPRDLRVVNTMLFNTLDDYEGYLTPAPVFVSAYTGDTFIFQNGAVKKIG